MIERKFIINNVKVHIKYHPDLDELIYFFIPREDYEDNYSKISITSTINFTCTPPCLVDGVKISKSIRKNECKSSYLFNNGLLVNFQEVSSKHFVICIEIFICSTWQAKLKRSFIGYNNVTKNQFVQAIRHALVYPYLLLLQKNYNTLVSHGTAFLLNNKCYAILGFDGIGKSIIASLVCQQGGEILSDNFIVFDGTEIYGVPEPLRIINNQKNHYYGKRFIRIGLSHTKKILNSLIYSYIGNEYKFSLSDLDFMTITQQLTNYLPEFYDYNRFCTVASVSNPEIIKLKLPTLSDVKFYENQRADLEDNRKLLDDITSL